ncbi:hypothetical protein [Deinococcus soli (ex Cha et al. 2016)]|uniref:hypothetical protein n=1 Tax=Deinococcus soli (ex Cha et al. 2016) TaxID=1309411 RepID=UPI00166BAF98|nr:hypothetical protein [Deinococcus soli (ex Cha et al. 2016)]GGB60615.1 hypothetical protein GCM10008019_15690 [Deinococcus soli (ex Cha et al. 2016)]
MTLNPQPQARRFTAPLRLDDLSGLGDFDSAYWGLAPTRNHTTYFALCSHHPGGAATLFKHHPEGGITAVCSLQGVGAALTHPQAVGHGKIHTKLFWDAQDRLVFASHFAYPGALPQAVQYEGGRVFTVDPQTGHVTDHGVLMAGEGIVTMAFDAHRHRVYALTSPGFHFIAFDLREQRVLFQQQVSTEGSICRDMCVDPEGTVYLCAEPHLVYTYRPGDLHLTPLHTDFGQHTQALPEWSADNKTGANHVGRRIWRCVTHLPDHQALLAIDAADNAAYLIHLPGGTTTCLGTVDPHSNPDVYPSLSLTGEGDIYHYLAVDGRFDYQLSQRVHSPCRLARIDVAQRTITFSAPLTDGQQCLLGVAGASASHTTLHALGMSAPLGALGGGPDDRWTLTLATLELQA